MATSFTRSRIRRGNSNAGGSSGLQERTSIKWGMKQPRSIRNLKVSNHSLQSHRYLKGKTPFRTTCLNISRIFVQTSGVVRGGGGKGPGCGFKFAGSSRSRVPVRVRRSKPYGNLGAKLYDYDTFTRPPKYKYQCYSSDPFVHRKIGFVRIARKRAKFVQIFSVSQVSLRADVL